MSVPSCKGTRLQGSGRPWYRGYGTTQEQRTLAIWSTTRRSTDNSDHKYDLQSLASALVLQSIETHYSYENQFKGVDVERPQQPFMGSNKQKVFLDSLM